MIYIKVCLVTILKVLKIKRQLNFVNVSYLFTPISYLEKTYTTTAREPSIYIFFLFKSKNIKAQSQNYVASVTKYQAMLPF